MFENKRDIYILKMTNLIAPYSNSDNTTGYGKLQLIMMQSVLLPFHYLTSRLTSYNGILAIKLCFVSICNVYFKCYIYLTNKSLIKSPYCDARVQHSSTLG
jgi:hypothetical protein